jgi:hypothetical protein
MSKLCMLKILISLFILTFSFYSFAQKQRNIMIVLDMSGSMNILKPHIGKRRVDIARNVLEGLLKNWGNTPSPGLIIFGHRSNGCADIEHKHKIASTTPMAVYNSIKDLKPLGKTPLGDALELAAKKMKYYIEDGSLVILTDGQETCNNNPCLVAKDLKRRGINFKAHVIGFDIHNQGTQNQLSCISKELGGNYYSANTSSQLEEALKKATKSSGTSKKSNRSQGTKSLPQRGNQIVKSKLTLTAIKTTTGQQVIVDKWEVYKANDEVLISTQKDIASPQFNLAPGKYDIIATTKDNESTITVDIAPNSPINKDLFIP